MRALSGQKLVDAVVEFLAPRSLLLVVDNCEHLLAAALGSRTRCCAPRPQLTILATSREPLRVPGEVVFRVPSLDIPDPEQTLEPRELLRYEAVRLFVERADAAAPGFALDEENAADVARICFRLDGLPLALELAAGRLGALGPAAIAERLDDRFRVLRSASHASPTRQQTLTATLQWSHDLLEPDERTLFRRLAVFAGGFELEAVESVCAGGELDRPASPTCSRVSSRSRWSPPTRAPRVSAATACSRPFACTRASGSTRRARAPRSPSGTPAGRLRLAEERARLAAARPRRREPACGA